MELLDILITCYSKLMVIKLYRVNTIFSGTVIFTMKACLDTRLVLLVTVT